MEQLKDHIQDEETIEEEWSRRLNCKKRIKNIQEEYGFKVYTPEEKKEKSKLKKAIFRKRLQRAKKEISKINAKES